MPDWLAASSLKDFGSPVGWKVRELRWFYEHCAALELAEGGEPIPPIGFVADVGCLVAGARRDPFVRNVVDVPGWPAGLAERYDDFVLGKLDTDPSAVRASEALARYKGRDHDRGLVFVIDQFRRRAGFDGILLNPAVIKSAPEHPARRLARRRLGVLRGRRPLAAPSGTLYRSRRRRP